MIHYICLVCPKCLQPFKRVKKEVARSRRLGRPLYCSLSCGTTARAKREARICSCGKKFEVKSRKRSARYCSASCASRFSMIEERREAQRRGGQLGAQRFIEKLRVDSEAQVSYKEERPEVGV